MPLSYPHHYKATISTPLYKEYQIQDTSGQQWISNRIQIKADDIMNVESPEYWLHYCIGRKWSKKALSPLFNTKYGNIYFGEMATTGNALLFLFSNEDLTIYYYPNVSNLGTDELLLNELIGEIMQKKTLTTK